MEKCSGDGQGTCKRCKDMGIWNRNWMSFLYKVEKYEGIYCYDCAKYLEEQKQAKENN